MIPSSTLIDMKDLSGSGVGSLLEKKIKRNIERKGFVIKYFWNFTSKSSSDTKNEKKDKFIYDFKTYKKIKLIFEDENNFTPIKDYDKYYYIVPGSQTNRALDSALLQPDENGFFNIIFFQITKFKKNFPSKAEYTKFCNIARKKFELIYKIKIKKMYFYFILALDFDNEKTKEILETKNIAYIYYSIKKDKFIKNGIIDLENLNIVEAEIKSNNKDDDYLYFNSKITLIKYMERFLQNKRRLEKGFEITERNFDAARNHLIKHSKNIYLDKENKKSMKDIVKKHSKIYKKSFIFKYIFCISPREFFHLSDQEDLIGIMIQENTKDNSKIDYNYIYKGEIYPEDRLIAANFLSFNKNKLNYNIQLDQDYLISQIPKKLWSKIYVFKIYKLLEKNNQ